MLAINKFLFFVDFLLLCNLLVCTIEVALRLRLHLFRNPHTVKALFRPTVIPIADSSRTIHSSTVEQPPFFLPRTPLSTGWKFARLVEGASCTMRAFYCPRSGIYRVENVSSVREKEGKWNKQPFERGVRRRGPWPTRGQVEVPVDLGQAPGAAARLTKPLS